jgi:PAS domain S-box-containing protein
MVFAASSARKNRSNSDYSTCGKSSVVVFRVLPDPEHSIYCVSPNIRNIYGIKAEELVEEPELWWSRIDSEDRERVFSALRDIAGAGEIQIEYRFLHPDGHSIWVRDEYFPIYDSEGNLQEIDGVRMNITRWKRQEIHLPESAKRLEEFIEHSPDGVALLDSVGGILHLNERMMRMTNSSPLSFGHKTLMELINPVDNYSSEQWMRDLFTTGKATGQFACNRRNNQQLYLELNGVVIDRELYVVYAKDVTSEQSAKHRIERRDMLTNALMDSMNRLLEADNQKQKWTHNIQEEILEKLGHALEVEVVILAMCVKGTPVDNPKDGFRVVDSWVMEGHSKPPEAINEVMEWHGAAASWRNRLKSGRYVIERVANSYAWASAHALLKTLEVNSLFIVPMFMDGELWGFMGFGKNDGGRRWQIVDRRILIAAVDSITLAIRNRIAQNDIAKANEELHLQIERTNRMAEDARKANEAKSEFVANMSHEIRTPLNSILGFTSLMLDSVQSQTHLEWLSMVQSSGKSLLGLVNEVLDFSKVESGETTIQYAPLQFKDFIQEVVSMFKHEAAKKDLALSLEVEDIPELIMADDERLKEVITNLLVNAIKFTEQGSITVRCYCDIPKRPKNHVKMCCEVSDTGIGIENDKLERIFQPFSQADNSNTRKYEGTGLGLAISQRLANKMNGDIEVQSIPGRGSTFRFYWGGKICDDKKLKQSRVGPQELKKSVQMLMNAELGKQYPLKILVAEDNMTNQKIVNLILRRLGYKASFAENGALALEAIKKEQFDLIFMDVHMPEMDGLTATERIREYEKSSDLGHKLWIIALTAHAMSGDREKCLKSGMDDYMTKPVNLKALVDALQNCIEHVHA